MARAGVSEAPPALIVEAPPELAGAAAAIRALPATAFAPSLTLVGAGEQSGPIAVRLAEERSALARNAPSWVAAYAIGPLSTIIVFPARIPTYPDRSVEAVVVHEVAHVLIYRAAWGGEVPRWFDEGLAIVAAREWGLEDRGRVAFAVLGADLRGIGDLERAFRQGGAQVAGAYAVAGATMRTLLRRFGVTMPARVLAAVAAGSTFEGAFAAVTGVPAAEAVAAALGRERVWNTWVPLLTSSTFLWMLITLLAMVAIRRRRERDRTLRADWERAEAGVELDDDAFGDDPRRYN